MSDLNNEGTGGCSKRKREPESPEQKKKKMKFDVEDLEEVKKQPEKNEKRKRVHEHDPEVFQSKIMKLTSAEKVKKKKIFLMLWNYYSTTKPIILY